MNRVKDVDAINAQFALSISDATDLVKSWLDNKNFDSNNNKTTSNLSNSNSNSKDSYLEIDSVAGLEPVASMKGGLGSKPKSTGQARNYNENNSSSRALKNLQVSIDKERVAKSKRDKRETSIETSESDEDIGRTSVGWRLKKHTDNGSLYDRYKKRKIKK